MNVVVAGGTGLIGSFLLKALDANAKVDSVIAITRSAQKDFGKVKWQIAELGDVAALENLMQNSHVAISCLGTTMKIAGSKEAFEKVDYQYVVNLAQTAKASGIDTFRVVSALGANANSGIYYNGVKGKMENAVSQIGFNNLLFFRPSLLLGPRKEYRLGEKIGAVMMRLFSPLMVGGMRKNKPIQAETVAKAIAHSLFSKVDADFVHYDEIVKLESGL